MNKEKGVELQNYEDMKKLVEEYGFVLECYGWSKDPEVLEEDREQWVMIKDKVGEYILVKSLDEDFNPTLENMRYFLVGFSKAKNMTISVIRNVLSVEKVDF